MVDEMSSFFNHRLSNSVNETRKRRLQIKATLDKNNSQRINDFRVK
jgi:hypothetical protein